MFFVTYWSIGSGNWILPSLVFFYCIKQNYTYFRFWPGFIIINKGLQYEDYRNVGVKKDYPNPFVFWPILYLGFEVIPAIMIFLGHLPLYYVFSQPPENNCIYSCGVIFTFGAVLIELIGNF